MTDDFDYDSVEQMPTLDDALAEMTDNSDSLPSPTVLYGLSGLSSVDMTKLNPVWTALDSSYRRILMQMLVDASESNFELTYEQIGYANLDADQAEVRQAAIELLWEDETLSLMKKLISMMQNDPNVLVRAEAAKALGRFILLGELGDLPGAETKQAQDVLLDVLRQETEPVEVRLEALESIANCTRQEVIAHIEKSYKSEDDDMRVSSVIAMGRTCDKQWENIILHEIEHGDGDIQLESIRAAGELQLEGAVSFIVKFVPDANREMLETIIWSLGEIGGKDANRTLELIIEKAESEDDEDLLELLDDAIGNASLASGNFTMLDFTGVDDLD